MRHHRPGTPTSRRKFLAASAAALSLPAIAGPRLEARQAGSPPEFRLRSGGHATGFDPWIEIIGDAFRHNVREVSRLAGGTPIMAVVKNNAYGLGDQIVGPIVASCPEVAALACTRVSEALAMRRAGVRKPILNMAETSEAEIEELARQDVWPSVWLDDAQARLGRVARRIRKPVRVHAFIDTGMNREGIPDYRAMAWLEGLSRDRSIRIDGTYMMFNHDLDADRQAYARFQRFVGNARQAGCQVGKLHGSPSFEVLYLPEARFDFVRPGNLLFGNFATRPELTQPPDLKPVFRFRARIARLEQLRQGETASFARGGYVIKSPTWVAMLPTGHTDGYPATAANTCSVLIGGRLYPVVSVVASAHVLVEIGPDRTVEVGDVATLIGPDDPAIAPHAVAEKSGVGFYPLITKMSPFLPRRVV
jgi:alanine racemase